MKMVIWLTRYWLGNMYMVWIPQQVYVSCTLRFTLHHSPTGIEIRCTSTLIPEQLRHGIKGNGL